MNQAFGSWGRATFVAADDDFTHLWDSVCSADVFFYLKRNIFTEMECHRAIKRMPNRQNGGNFYDKKTNPNGGLIVHRSKKTAKSIRQK